LKSSAVGDGVLLRPQVELTGALKSSAVGDGVLLRPQVELTGA